MVQGVRPTSAHENCETGLMAGASVQPWNQSLARRAVIDSYSPRDVPAGNATQRDLYQAGPMFNAPFVTRTEVPGGGRGRSPKLLIPFTPSTTLFWRQYWLLAGTRGKRLGERQPTPQHAVIPERRGNHIQ